jgi:upstream stimulatory factor
MDHFETTHVMDITPKELIESDDENQEDAMDIPTTVTIVEEDGSTSVVDDASVSSILTDGGPHSSIQFGQTQGGGVTYRVVGIADDNAYQATNNVQVIQPTLNGQYYVIGSQDVLGRSISSRPQIIDARTLGRIGKTAVRDEKKRATHNEVERRRRDKINGWINKLAKIVPTCSDDNTNQGQVHQNSSKGGILAKACEYINELRSTNCRLAATLKEHENTAEELEELRREISELRRENIMLKQQLGPTEEDSTVVIATLE